MQISLHLPSQDDDARHAPTARTGVRRWRCARPSANAATTLQAQILDADHTMHALQMNCYAATIADAHTRSDI